MSNHRDDIIKSIKEEYVHISGKNLRIYGVPHHFLKDFVTSESDRKKETLKIPEEGFRLKEEDVITEADPMTALLDEIPNFQKTKALSLYQKNKSEKKVMIDEFKVLKVLGKGSFGKVRAFVIKRDRSIWLR